MLYNVQSRYLFLLVLALAAVTGALYFKQSVVRLSADDLRTFSRFNLSDGGILFVGRHEITIGQWNACVASGGCPKLPVSKQYGSDHPVTNVNWFDVQSYIAWFREKSGLKVRLPTQHEWLEFADNHAPRKKEKLFTDPRLSWAADYDLTAEPPVKITQTSGHFGVNINGVSDLKGNVWEWTATQCGNGETVGADGCRSGRLLMGEHVAVLSDVVRDPGNASCGAGIPPANLGFRLVY